MSDSLPAYQLVYGDFFEKARQIPDASVDLAIVDPPYFLSEGSFSVSSGRAVSVDKGYWDHLDYGVGSLDFHMNWVSEVKRLLAPNGSVVVSGTYHSIYECGYSLGVQDFKILNEIVWFKPNGAPNLSGRRLAASHESIIWASKSSTSKHTFNYEHLKEMEFPGDKIKMPGKQMRSVWWIPNTPAGEKRMGHHPTQKPEALMDRLILAFSKPGDLVLDPFMGSGTSAISSFKLQRNFVGFEKDLTYFELARKRLGQLTND